MEETLNNHSNPANSNIGLADVVSELYARKLSRLGWVQGQTIMSFHKRSNCTVYDLVNKKGVAGWGWDAPNEEEIIKMCDLVGCPFDNYYSLDRLTCQLIEYCRIYKVKLSGYNIT